MRRLTRDRAMTLGFVALAFALALWQRPGWATSDTKIDLHVDPVAFLGQVASVWSPSTDLGAVHSAQYTGYLWPMGPFFAGLHLIGLAPWVAQRLWLGLLFALSAWGALRLLDVIVGRPRGVAHLVAAAFYMLNPYTVMFTARTSVTLLGYVALPWLLVVVHYGVHAVRHRPGWRDWRGWWWAAAFALILTSLGGGINGAVVGWMLVGPLTLLLYEPVIGSVRWRDSAGFLLRAGLLGTLASLWWIVPLLIHARYGINFLQFTEQPLSIWGTNSSTEALRLMAYWVSYIGVGFFGAQRPMFSEAGTLLFNPFVVGASLLIPALALGGFVWTRRWRYGPFLLLVLLVGAVIEVAGFPNGTPARKAMEWIYHHVSVVAFMRTTQKAAPLVAIGVAGLLGLAAHRAWGRLRRLRRGRVSRVALVAAPVGLAALIALAALPLLRGTAVERQLVWRKIPTAWTAAGRGLDRELAPNSRALVLPGQIFANYTWGGTTDAILPRLTHRPVAVRYETPYSDPHAFDLLATVDGLVQQRRFLPGQLSPLLRLMGVGAVVTGSDDDTTRSGAIDPAGAAAELAGQGLSRPSRSYGPTRAVPPPREDFAPSPALPQVRRYDIPVGRGIVHVEPVGPATIVDGGAGGLADMAAVGILPASRPIFYAGDLSASELRRQAARGADVVVTDSNRRRRFLPEFSQQSLGPTLGENQPFAADTAVIDPFPRRGSDAQTVSVLQGARYLTAPAEGGLLEFPEHTPIEAFDGDPSTMWVADRYLPPSMRWIQIGFDKPRDVPYVDLLPIRDPYGIETEVQINGVRAKIGPGLNRIPLHLKHVAALRVAITHVIQPKGNLRGSGGFREIRIPGIHLSQPLRPPVLVAKALAGQDLRRTGLTYLFERTTGDQPFLRNRQTGSPLLEFQENRADPEQQIDRVLFAPAARSYAVDAWVHPAVDAPDSGLDRLMGWRGAETFDSSGRFENQPRYRASSAFDGRADTAWVGIWAPPSAPDPWISWRTPRPLTVSRLRLAPARLPIFSPTVVRLSWSGGATPPLRVGASGDIELPRPVRARGFQMTIVAAQLPTGVTPRDPPVRAVGIGSLMIPGLKPVALPAGGPLRAACGSVQIRVGGRQVPLQPRGTVAELDAGQPLRAQGCAGEARMGAAFQRIRSLPGAFSVDLLRLSSPAPLPLPPASGGGKVLDPGQLDPSSLNGVRIALAGPSWLVLGQSFSNGWRATCEGRSLGQPRPIDGYANGWLAPAGCSRVAFTFAPQSTARLGYAISAVVCALLLALLLAGRLLRRRQLATVAPHPPLPEHGTQRTALPRATAIAFLATIPLCLLFAFRTGALIFPALTFILWRGIDPRWLTAIAAGLLGVVVPITYALTSPKNRGGYNFEYSLQLIWAHWIGVAALVLLITAAWKTLATTPRGRRPSAPPPTENQPPHRHVEPERPDLAPPGAADPVRSS